MDLSRLTSDGTPGGTALREPEERAIAGEELFWPPTSTAGVIVTERTAIQSSAVLSAHITISTDVSITPLEVCQRGPDDSLRVASDHYLHPILTRTPDGRRTPCQFFGALMGHALSYAGGYAEIVRRGNGKVARLELCDPRLTRDSDGPDGRHGYQSGNGWVAAENMIHVAGFGFDGISGYSIIQLIRQAIGVTLGSESYASDFFANGTEPQGVIELPGSFDTPEKRQRFREGLEDRHQGPGKRHRLMVLTQGGKWVKVGAEPEKAQLVETRQYQSKDVVRPWRIPPHKIGDFSEAHLANIGAANLDYVMTTLMGWFTVIQQQLNLKLLTEAEYRAGYFIRHDLKSLLKGDPLTRSQIAEIDVRNGIKSRNDVRRAEGENPIPADQGGDLYTIQAQVIPLAMAGKPFGKPGDAPAEEPDPDAAGEPDPADPEEGSEGEPAARSLRFNENHDKGGRFGAGGGSGGGGGGGGGGGETVHAGGEEITPDRAKEIGATLKDAGKAKGESWSFDVRPPSGKGEGLASGKAEGKNQPLIVSKSTPVYREVKDGAITHHTVAGKTEATTFPDADGKKWVSRERGISNRPEETRDETFRTRNQALKNSRKWAAHGALDMTTREAHTGKTVDKAVDKIARTFDGGETGKWTNKFSLIAPRAKKEAKP